MYTVLEDDPAAPRRDVSPLKRFLDPDFPPTDHSLGKRSLCGLERSDPVVWVHASKLAAKGGLEKAKPGQAIMKL